MSSAVQQNDIALCTPREVHHQGSDGSLHSSSEVLTCLVRRLPGLAPVSSVERMLRSPTGSYVYVVKPYQSRRIMAQWHP